MAVGRKRARPARIALSPTPNASPVAIAARALAMLWAPATPSVTESGRARPRTPTRTKEKASPRRSTCKARTSVTLGVAGAHNIANALAAIATGLALGVGESAIRAGLARFRPTAMRSEVRRWRGVTWLNDCYNANPSSMRAALRWLADLKGELKGHGRAIAVLGDMLELGEGSVRIHQDIGEELARQGTDYLLTVGDLAAEIAAGARGAGRPGDRVIVTQEHR